MPDKQCASNPLHQEHRHHYKPKQRNQSRGCPQVPQRDERARRVDDDAGPLEADHGDEQSNAHSDRMLQRSWNRGDEPLAQPDPSGENEKETGHGHGAERHLPWHVHGEDHREGKE